MFKFKLKVRNEHKISMIAKDVTIYDKLTLSVKYCSSVVLHKIRALVRFLIKPLSYKAKISYLSTAILCRVIPKGIETISSTTNRMHMIMKLFFNKNLFNHVDTMKEKFYLRLLPKNIAYISIDAFKETIGSFINNIKCKYKINSDLKEQITQRLHIINILESESILSFVSHIKEEMNSVFTNTVKMDEKLSLKSLTKNTAYVYIDEIKEITGAFINTVKCKYKINSDLIEQIIQKLHGITVFKSESLLSFISYIKEEIECIFNNATQIKESFLTKIGLSSNKSKLDNSIENTGIITKTSIEQQKYSSEFASNRTNNIQQKSGISSITNSDTEINELKCYQYYIRKLIEYDNVQLNKAPKDLMSFCYVVNKDWDYVKRSYSTWADLKEDLSSWDDLR